MAEHPGSEHQLYLNLGESRWVIARCSCHAWHHERMLHVGQQVAEVVRELEEEFERHAGVHSSRPYTPPLPAE